MCSRARVCAHMHASMLFVSVDLLVLANLIVLFSLLVPRLGSLVMSVSPESGSQFPPSVPLSSFYLSPLSLPPSFPSLFPHSPYDPSRLRASSGLVTVAQSSCSTPLPDLFCVRICGYVNRGHRHWSPGAGVTGAV